MADRELNILLNAKDNLSKTIGSAGKAFDKFSKAATQSSKQFAAGLTVAAAGLTAFAKSSLTAANESERAQKRLETLMMNVKGATLEQVDSLKALAAEQMKLTTLDDDSIIAGQSQLATFALQAETIGKLTPALNDLAVSVYGVNVSQESMISMGNLLGKAMQGQASALTRYGVTMTEAQKEIIKTGTESERAAMMVEVLNSNFGGLAKGMKNTTEGALASANVAFGEMQETLGSMLQPYVIDVANAFAELATKISELKIEDINKAFRENEEIIKMIAGALVAVLAPAIATTAFSAALFVAALGPLAALGALIVKHWDSISASFQFAKNTMSELLPLAEATFGLLISKSQEFIEAFIQRFGWLKDSAIVAWFWIRYESLVMFNAIIRGYDLLKNAAAETWFQIKYESLIMFNTIANALSRSIDFFKNYFETIVVWAEWKYSILRGYLFGWEDGSGNIIGHVQTMFIGFFNSVIDAAQIFWNKHGENVNGFFEIFINSFNVIKEKLGFVIDGFIELWDSVKEPLGLLWESIKMLIDPLIDLGINIMGLIVTAFEPMLGITLMLVDGFLKLAEFVLPIVIDAAALFVAGLSKMLEGINWVIDGIEDLIGWLNDLIDKWNEWTTTSYTSANGETYSAFDQMFTGQNIIDTFSPFAKGGIVPGVGNKDTVPAMLTPGEEVLTANDPRHSNNGGGMNINFNAPISVRNDDDINKIANMISRSLYQEKKLSSVGIPT